MSFVCRGIARTPRNLFDMLSGVVVSLTGPVVVHIDLMRVDAVVSNGVFRLVAAQTRPLTPAFGRLSRSRMVVVVFQSGNIDHWRGSHPAFTGRRESMTASIALKACFPDFSPSGSAQDAPRSRRDDGDVTAILALRDVVFED